MTELHTAALILLASSRNASYDAKAALKEAREMQDAIQAADWLASHERTLGIGCSAPGTLTAASGCDEEDRR